jgi:hypothetical protein
MKAPWLFMTGGDWLVVLTMLMISLAGIVSIATMPEGSRVMVTCGEELCFTAPLDQPRTLAIDGPLGRTKLVIDEQGARIVESPCSRKICVGMGAAKHTADLLACVPNRILVHIDGSSDKEMSYDLLSR